jgi:hypothetical protein
MPYGTNRRIRWQHKNVRRVIVVLSRYEKPNFITASERSVAYGCGVRKAISSLYGKVKEINC